MRLSKLARALLVSIVIGTLLAGLGLSFALGQSRRQPPTSVEKKKQTTGGAGPAG